MCAPAYTGLHIISADGLPSAPFTGRHRLCIEAVKREQLVWRAQVAGGENLPELPPRSDREDNEFSARLVSTLISSHDVETVVPHGKRVRAWRCSRSRPLDCMVLPCRCPTPPASTTAGNL